MLAGKKGMDAAAVHVFEKRILSRANADHRQQQGGARPKHFSVHRTEAP
jgi:hypothetical protein